MTSTYTPPGVSVQELVSTSVSPLLAVPAVVAVVGEAQGYIERTDQLILSGTTAAALPGLPTNATLVSVTAVTDVLHPGTAPNADGTYRVTNDYTVDVNAGTIQRVATDIGTGDGKIPDGALVAVAYRYLPDDYFDAAALEDIGSIADRYGSAWQNGAIFSELTYAAQIAFENGARFVVCQPLFARATQGDPTTAKQAPVTDVPTTPGASSNAGTWADTLYALRDVEDINVFIPVVGQSTAKHIDDATWLSIGEAFQDHMQWLIDNDQLSVTIFGEDSTDNTGTYAANATIRNHAGNLRSRYGGALARQSVLINVSSFTRARPDALSTVVAVGGQYMAAAVAGMVASRPVQKSLTRQQISGFVSVTDSRSKQDKNDDAATGLFVVEQKGIGIFVRHSITLDITSEEYQELSVVRAQQRMIESLRQTVDTNIIGQIVADAQAPFTVKSTIITVLESLKGDGTIVDYDAVQVRQLTNNPTTIEVRFNYLPAFPVNYVTILFAVDLSSTGVGTVTTA